MTKETAIKLFEQKEVRSLWSDEDEKWYFSVIDIISILTEQPTHQGARNYWKVLKSRLVKEGNETVTNCNRLKLLAEDGKMRLTDVADTEQLFRLIQSVPSPKAEPFKIWLAQVGRERIAKPHCLSRTWFGKPTLQPKLAGSVCLSERTADSNSVAN
jgi:hypothetical protein